MNISDLMSKLAALYPSHFRDEATQRAWGEEYRRVLRNVAGDALARAWEATMREWDKAGPPKPADILRHCPRRETAAANERKAAEIPPLTLTGEDRRKCDEWMGLVMAGMDKMRAWEMVYGVPFPTGNPWCRNRDGRMVERRDCTAEEQRAYDRTMAQRGRPTDPRQLGARAAKALDAAA